MAEVNDESESKVSHTFVSILTESPLINVPTPGKSVQQHREKIEKRCRDIHVRKASDDAGFERKVSPGKVL